MIGKVYQSSDRAAKIIRDGKVGRMPPVTDLGIEPIDGDRANTVVLNDLVIRSLRSTALNQRIPVSKDTQRILTNVGPPDILDSAGSKTMHAFDLVLADNSVLESGSRFEDEDGVCVASL